MICNRVVVTGMAGVTALGCDYETIESNLRANHSAIKVMSDRDRFKDFTSKLAAPVENFSVPEYYTRKSLRTMTRVSHFAVLSTEQALIRAGLLDNPAIMDGRMGIAHGSCLGGIEALHDFGGLLDLRDSGHINATSFLRLMSHTAAVNIGLYFNLKGCIIPTSSACTAGSQGIGYAYEAIKYKRQQLMVAGGSEELNPVQTAVFDNSFAASTRQENPHTTPRPFDKDRDGLVIGEGACTLILEELDHAQARGAPIFAEIVGYVCNSDGDHPTHPNVETMQLAMKQALADAGLSSQAIGYVSAHGTATELGDIAESHATRTIFGSHIPISSMKGHLGHTLGACGAIEAWWAIEMMNRGWFAPTLNLENLDPRCAEMDYLINSGRSLDCEYVMSNNFAFGGINTSLILKRWH